MPDIGADSIVGVIASSTAGYLGIYAPVFSLGIGVLLAFGIFGYILALVAPIRARQLREAYDSYEEGTHHDGALYYNPPDDFFDDD